MKKVILDQYEHTLTKRYRSDLYSKFVKAIMEYKLIDDGDKICVCISGGKDSMCMAKLFQAFQKYSQIKFEVEYLVMNPGYNEVNLKKIKDNLEKLNIPAHIEQTDIFEIANMQSKSPCFLCAKMRRGALYNLAKKYGCNKIALGHHYDDVIETTLMSLLNAGAFQTMLPKLVSGNYKHMELIRPMYFVREKDVIRWAKFNNLDFIRCACRFTEEVADENKETNSQRAATKKLIHDLLKYNDQVEKNLFIATTTTNLDMLLGYKTMGKQYSFLDNYEQKKKKIFDEQDAEEKN